MTLRDRIRERLIDFGLNAAVVAIYPFIWILKKLSPRGGWGD